MITEVLRWISEKKYVKIDEISRDLGIPSGLVELIIRELVGRKYIVSIADLSKGACNTCPLRSICKFKVRFVKSYMLTERGKRLLERSYEKTKVPKGSS